MTPGPPPPKSRPSSPPPVAPPSAGVTTNSVDLDSMFTDGKLQGRGDRVIIWGAAGAGKTTLASLAPKAVLIDLEGSTNVEMPRFEPRSYDDVCAVLASDDKRITGAETIIVDTLSSVENMIRDNVIRSHKEDGKSIERLDDIGWGRGPGMVYDAARRMIPLIDRHVREGRSVVLLAHGAMAAMTTPNGEKYDQAVPRLLHGEKGTSLRNLFVEWAAEVVHIASDRAVNTKTRTAEVSETRTLYFVTVNGAIAKSRTLAAYQRLEMESKTDDRFWQMLQGARA